MAVVELRRRQNWRSLFFDFIEARRATPLVWGSSDCGLFGADAAIAITGFDVAAELRGYDSAEGAAKALLRSGHRSMKSYLDERLPRVDRPRCGDFVVIPGPPLGVLLVFDRAGGAWGQGEHGLVRGPVQPGAVFWGIG